VVAVGVALESVELVGAGVNVEVVVEVFQPEEEV
jgi:hypothetical protein